VSNFTSKTFESTKCADLKVADILPKDSELEYSPPTLYTSVSQTPGPGINYTEAREAWRNYNMLQDFISPMDN